MSSLEAEWHTSHPPIGEQQIWVEGDDRGEVITTFCPQISGLFRAESFLDQFQFIVFEVKCVRVVLSTYTERSYSHIQELQVLGSDPETGNEMIVRFVVKSVGDRMGIEMLTSGLEFPLSEELQMGILWDLKCLYDRWVMGEEGDYIRIDLERIRFSERVLPVILISSNRESLLNAEVRAREVIGENELPTIELWSSKWSGEIMHIIRVSDTCIWIKRIHVDDSRCKYLYTFYSVLSARKRDREIYSYVNALFRAVQEQLPSEECEK